MTKAVVRAAGLLEVSQIRIAEILGVSSATASRMASGNYQLTEDSKQWELAALFVRLFRSLDAIVGNDAAKVAAWMESYNQALNGIPRELIESPQGLVMTLQYVDAMRATS